ncbi:unnamed protein product, partial [Durusdinium trenchii]
TSSVQTGLVLSVWRGVKAPKLICGDVPINCVVAFRAVQLDLQIPPEEGALPFDSRGSVCITISEESAQAIKRLPEMKSWSVQPTMAPGRGKKADGLMPGKQNKGKKSKTDAAKTKIRRGKYAKKAKHSKLGKKGKKKKAKGKNQEATTEVDAQLVAEEAREQADKKKKKKKPVAVSLSVQPPSSKEYRRTQTGFSVIRGQVQELLDLDQAAFPDAPAFSHEGLCRLKIDAAKERTRQQIIEESSEAIDAL